MEISRSLLLKVAALGVVLTVVVGGSVGFVGYQYSRNPPQVESVNSEWGDVSEGQTEIETDVVVSNPNDVGIPKVVDLQYTTTLNGVTVIEGSTSSVGVSPGRNEIAIPATMDNRAIAEWWVTHVNNGEQSRMAVTATVVAPGGVEQSIPVRSSTIETNMLDSMQSSGARTVTVQGEEFVTIEEQSAAWGTADMERTPIDFSATLTNNHDHGLTLDGLGYVITMNDVVVGEGRTTDGVTIRPGESGEVGVTAAIDTPKMADWWATHVSNDESTRMTVAMFGLVERDGELRRVPFELFAQDLRFTTNLLEGGGTNVRPIEGGGSDAGTYEQPTVVESSREWGEVGKETTELRASATLDNPNDGSVNEFVQLSSTTRVAINDVVVANHTESMGALEPGRNEVAVTVPWDNTATPQWWARHVNNGERSTRSLSQQTTADLGFTKFDVREESGDTTFETDVLAGLESDDTVDVSTESGQTVAEIRKTRANWGEADTEESPIEVTVTMKNTFDTEITLTDLRYTFLMNDVTVGDGTAPEEYTLAPGETRELTYSITLDSQKMDEWWVSHIRNDEVTTVDVQTSVLVETPLGSERAEVESLTQTQNVTTDFLGQDEG